MKSLRIVTLFRLLIVPLLVTAIMVAVKHAFHIDSDVLFVVVLMSAMPAGSLVAVYSKKDEDNTRYASSAIVHTMLFSAITIPLIAALAQKLLY